MTMFSIRLEEEIIKEIANIAKPIGISGSAFVRKALKSYIKIFEECDRRGLLCYEARQETL